MENPRVRGPSPRCSTTCTPHDVMATRAAPRPEIGDARHAELSAIACCLHGSIR